MLTHPSLASWFDWRRRDTRDAIVLLSLAALAFVAAHFFDLAPKLFQFAVDYASWEVDDMIFVVFVLSIEGEAIKS